MHGSASRVHPALPRPRSPRTGICSTAGLLLCALADNALRCPGPVLVRLSFDCSGCLVARVPTPTLPRLRLDCDGWRSYRHRARRAWTPVAKTIWSKNTRARVFVFVRARFG